MLYMWKEEKGKPYYRFQTDEKQLYRIMRRRQGFKLTAWGDNCNIWVFVVEYSRLFWAKKGFKSICGKDAKFDEKEDIFHYDQNL